MHIDGSLLMPSAALNMSIGARAEQLNDILFVAHKNTHLDSSLVSETAGQGTQGW